MTEKLYLTTAIDYVNGRPHMGHAMEKVGADVLARSRRARGADVWLVVGATALPYVGSLLEDVPPPRVAVARSCAKALCVAVLSWTGNAPRAMTRAGTP